MSKKLVFVLGIFVSCLCIAEGQSRQIVLFGNTDSVFPDPARVKSPTLSPGEYELTLGGPGVQPSPVVKTKYHYAYIVAYGQNTEVSAALNGLGDKKIIKLPYGGIISAFLRDTDADRSGSVTLTVKNIASGNVCNLQLFDAANSVDLSKLASPPIPRVILSSKSFTTRMLEAVIDDSSTSSFNQAAIPATTANVPAHQTKLTDLPAGQYRLTLAGDGIMQYPNSPLSHYAFIAVRGEQTEISACLFGKGDSLMVGLPKGGIVSAFLQDSDPTDNSGSVTITVEQVSQTSLR